MKKRDLNMLAVLVAALAHFVLGAVWFTYFSKAWIAGTGITPVQMQEAQAKHSPVPYLIAFIASFGMAVVIARMIKVAGVQTAAGGARLALMLGVGLAMLPMMVEVFFEMRHLNFALIVGGYPAVGSVIMGTILGGWQKKSADQTLTKSVAA